WFLRQLRPRSGSKIPDLKLHIAKAVPVIDARRERETAAAGGGHQVLHTFGHAEGNGPHVAVLLTNTETHMPLAAAHLARRADNLQVARQKERFGITRAVRL